jgi:TolB-like protein/Tfp pilus assembly protein PilF
VTRGGPLNHGSDVRSVVSAALADRYTIEAEAGRGGMAMVFRALDRRHDRPVAIKVVQPGLLTARESAERFLREIRYAAQLTHPHILPLFDSGEISGVSPPLLYYVMPYLEGETLRQRLERERQLPVAEVIRIARALAGALDHAHRRQILHRDIKPENILLHEGEPLLSDFGVARGLCEVCEAEAVTEPGMAVGTPAYMSPEQASGDPVLDLRSDQYGLACVIYEMLAGQPPFAGSGPRATMARQAVEVAPPVRGFRPDTPVALEQALSRALSKSPGERFASMAEFLHAMDGPARAGPPARGFDGGRLIAVLPFVNASPDPEFEYFSDGMTDEVISLLVNVRGLRVASRTSVFAMKGRREDVRSLGAQLGASAVLEGTVRKAASRLRVTAQLTDVADGRVLWSERYEREDRDVFAIQDDIARAIVDRLRMDLVQPIGELHPHRYTDNLRAYDLYLRGRFAWNQRTDDSVTEAIRLFQAAVVEDPRYALAYTGLADAHALHLDYRVGPVAEGMRRAREYAEQAIALDDSLAEAHCSLAWVTFIHDWEWDRAGHEFRRAIELNPRYATARQWHAWYQAAMGRLAEALADAHRAAELDPASVSIRRGLGWLYAVARESESGVAVLRQALVMNPEAVETRITLGLVQEQSGQLREAEASLRGALEISPQDTHALATLARTLVRAGRREEAERVAAKVRGLEASRYVSPTDLAKLALGLGEFDAAFAALDRARRERRGWLVYLKVDPLFDPIRSDPRFGELMRLMRLVP